MAANLFYKQADESCPSCGAIPGVFWRDGGSFQTRTVCICGRKTRWALGGHDAVARPSDDEVFEMEDCDPPKPDVVDEMRKTPLRS